MARARRTSDASNIRVFRTESGSELAELDDIGFGDEDQLHRLIESNIETLFPGLMFLSREFRQLDGGQYIPDTLAFDEQQNTFVVIEYKNKLDRGVIDQTKAYLRRMKKNKPAIVMAYLKSEGDGLFDLESYNWDVYAIIMAPEFSRNQIDSTEDDKSLELHEIRRYDVGVLTVRRVGGGHERPATTHASSPGAKAARTQATTRRSDLPPDTNKQAAAPRLNGDIVLPDIEHVPGMSHPTELARPDGSRVSLKSWRGILVGVADWLVSEGRLDESHCPMPIGKNNALLNTRPAHQNGTRSRHFKKAGHLYVFVNVNGANAIRYSIRLIETAGLNPSDFKAYFGDSVRPTRPTTTPPMSARVTITRGSSVPGCEKTNKCYDPHTVTVGVGGKVVWTNDDVGEHMVASGVLADYGPDGTFDSTMIAPGAEFSHVFEEAGEYPYFDVLRPWMQGVVIVKDIHDPA